MSWSFRLAKGTVYTMQARRNPEQYDEPPRSASSSSTLSFSAEYTPLSPTTAEDKLVDIAHPYTGILDLPSGRKADGLCFQPCATARCQDRYVIEQFAVPGTGQELWTLTGVFDGESLTPTTHSPALSQLCRPARSRARSLSVLRGVGKRPYRCLT